jgi:hypothetical protein
MVNEWDGNLKIDGTNNSILSARMVAGVKNDDNTFSGVMLGEYGTTNSDGSLTSTATGLYGFSFGKQTFAFKDDGTAFIGASGAGRIEFNGNDSTIKDALGNMTIDLDDGLIDAKNFTL